MGWILFLNEDELPCAWPDESTIIEVNKNNEISMSCGKREALPAESPQHTNDWEQVLLWVEGDNPGDNVVEPEED